MPGHELAQSKTPHPWLEGGEEVPYETCRANAKKMATEPQKVPETAGKIKTLKKRFGNALGRRFSGLAGTKKRSRNVQHTLWERGALPKRF
jgi:hypothetical protein